MKKLIIFLFVIFIFIGCFWFFDYSKPHTNEGLILSRIMNSEGENYKHAVEQREFVFPQDHGAHPKFKTEWWYVTGNVANSEGYEFGYQVTFFRNALTPEQTRSKSDWAGNQFYMAHAAVTDISNQEYYTDERFSRSALGLAGVKINPKFSVWLDDWKMQSQNQSMFPLSINVKSEKFSIKVNLVDTKAVVYQGDNGLSQKGPEVGNASYYYAYTRLKTQGEIRVNQTTFDVLGDSWMDREWSTSMLSKGVEGWDWFSIQLNNNTELMFYRLRKKSGAASKYSKGSFILADGKKIQLTNEQVNLKIQQYWTSPNSDIEYPIKWKLTIPSLEINLFINAALANQEFNASFRYWEGAIKVNGTYQKKQIRGKGYLELAGYQ